MILFPIMALYARKGCNHMTNEKKEFEIAEINETMLQSKIYFVRNQKVMLDFELAEIYGYTTKRFNEQIKNNIERFDEDFRFKLTREEVENLRSKNSTSSWGGSRYLPYAFTEQGIYMLMTVLKGELAIRQSKALIRTFKRMKDYIIENQGLIGEREYLQLSMQVTQNVLDTLEIRRELNEVEDQMADFCKEYPGVHISLKKTGGIFHDRFIVLDYGTDECRVFLCGASSKDAGARITSINEIFTVQMYDTMVGSLLNNPDLQLK